MAEDNIKTENKFKKIIFVVAIFLIIAGIFRVFFDKSALALFGTAGLCLIFVFLDKFKSIKFWGVEAELREVNRKAKDLPLEQQKYMELVNRVDESPRRAVDNAWDELEHSATALLGIFATSPVDVAVKLKNSGIPEDKYMLFEELLSLRNKIHKDRVLKSSTAIGYAVAAHKLAEYIRIHNLQDKVSVNEELKIDISEGSA